MNKLVKGSIAGAAGIALLLGGAGTFALWSDSQLVNAGNVQTGTLDISLAGSGTWEDISPELAVANAFDPALDRIVPGDTVTFTQDVTILATGKNLKANLAYNPASIVVAPALTTYVTVSLTASKVSGDATITANGANTYTILPVSGGSSVIRVVITVVFDPLTPLLVGQTLPTGVNLTAASFTLAQVRP